jgi:hypothetical protein
MDFPFSPHFGMVSMFFDSAIENKIENKEENHKMRLQLLIIFVCLVFVVFLPTTSMAGTWRDDFNGTALGPGWKFINDPNGNSSYKVANGWFSINLVGLNDIWGGVDNSVKLLRDAPQGDYSLETHIKIDPDKAAKTQNTWTFIVIFDDTNKPSSNWWYVARGGADEVNTEYVQNGAGVIQASLKGIGDLDVYLKAEKIGQDYTGYYKVKKDDSWIKVGTYKHTPLNPLKVGLCVKSWAVRDMVSNFDYFEMVGDKVEANTAVRPNGKLAATWGQLKDY